MNNKRCSWSNSSELYQNYHDTEWGIPIYDDKKLFEYLTLESFQAGLSWITVLKKRENFRKAFDNFSPEIIANYSNSKVEELLLDEGIIRNRKKIEATINNAKQFLKIQKEFGSFSNYQWEFVNYTPIINHYNTLSNVPAKTEISDAFSKDLKKRGFKFLGSTTSYAHMQAVGMVNDHLTSCFCHPDNSEF